MPKFQIISRRNSGYEFYHGITTSGMPVVITGKAALWLAHQGWPSESEPVSVIVKAEDVIQGAIALENGECCSRTGYRLAVLSPGLEWRRPLVVSEKGYEPDRRTVQVAYPGDLIAVKTWDGGGTVFEGVFKLPDDPKALADLDDWSRSAMLRKDWRPYLLQPADPLTEKMWDVVEDAWVHETGRTSSLLYLCPNCHQPYNGWTSCSHCTYGDWSWSCKHHLTSSCLLGDMTQEEAIEKVKARIASGKCLNQNCDRHEECLHNVNNWGICEHHIDAE